MSDLTTDKAASFPAANLGPSAQQWVRAVTQRIAQLEDRTGQHRARLSDLNKTVVDVLHAPRDGLFNFKGNWAAQTLGGPSIVVLYADAGGGAG